MLGQPATPAPTKTLATAGVAVPLAAHGPKPVPEPATWGLFAVGLVVIVVLARRRRNRSKVD